jgi:hypothetical protein
MPYTAPARSRGYTPSCDYNTCTQNLTLTNKALLASTAMANVAALSALEEQYCYVSPMGAARYKLLADTYTLVAARLLEE